MKQLDWPDSLTIFIRVILNVFQLSGPGLVYLDLDATRKETLAVIKQTCALYSLLILNNVAN
jgi:hypothetical protein